MGHRILQFLYLLLRELDLQRGDILLQVLDPARSWTQSMLYQHHRHPDNASVMTQPSAHSHLDRGEGEKLEAVHRNHSDHFDPLLKSPLHILFLKMGVIVRSCFRAPGMGITSGPRACTQASASWPGVHPFFSASAFTFSTSSRFYTADFCFTGLQKPYRTIRNMLDYSRHLRILPQLQGYCTADS